MTYDETRDPKWQALVRELNAQPEWVRARFYELAELGEMPAKDAAQAALAEARKAEASNAQTG